MIDDISKYLFEFLCLLSDIIENIKTLLLPEAFCLELNCLSSKLGSIKNPDAIGQSVGRSVGWSVTRSEMKKKNHLLIASGPFSLKNDDVSENLPKKQEK